MKLSLFESFADVMENIPVRAILRTLERESRMLEEDLAYQRPVPQQEAASILTFCRFVEAARKRMTAGLLFKKLPARHVQLYRKTLARLVDAEELPTNASDEFDKMVGDDWLKALDYKT